MIIGLRAGHSINCKGAIGLVDEYVVNYEIYKRLEQVLIQYGHTVINCNTIENTQGKDLRLGTDIANANGCNLFISIHHNASNGLGNGSEAWVYRIFDNETNRIGQRFVENMSKLGYANRGVKASNTLHDLKSTYMEAIIFEGFFVDNEKDVNIYNSLKWSDLIFAYANAIDTRIPFKGVLGDGGVNIPPSNNNGLTEDERLIKRGSDYVGARCKELQTKLIRLGYDCGGFGADGKFGQATYESLVKFQNDNGLVADGLAGEKTFKALNNAIDKLNKVYYLIQKGSEGALVKEAQEILIRLGYNLGLAGADGIFGYKTEVAAKEFQKANGLVADGIIGNKTWEKLL